MEENEITAVSTEENRSSDQPDSESGGRESHNWDWVDERIAELEQDRREGDDALGRQIADLCQRVSENEDRIEELEKERYYGKDQRIRKLFKWLVARGQGRPNRKTSITADEAADILATSPRTTRRYFSEMSNDYDAVAHRRADPNDASLPKRLCMDVEAFLEESDYELQ